MSVVDTLIAFGSLIVGIVGIWVTISLARQARARPYLAPVNTMPANSTSFDYSFPDLIGARNDGSAPAANSLGLIFPEQYSGQHQIGAKYTPTGSAVIGKGVTDTFKPQAGGTELPGDWMIGEYTLAPTLEVPGVMARLTLTYQDNSKRSYASIFDYVNNRWELKAQLDGIKLDISSLEKEYQRRKKEGRPFLPPPANGFNPHRRRLVLSIAIAVIGLAATGVEGVRIFSMQKSSGGPGRSPAPTPTPSPTPVPLGTRLYTRTGYGDQVNAVAWSPNGTRLASGSADTTVQMWDALTEKNPLTVNAPDSVNAVAWSPDGTRIASATDETNGNRNAVQVWDTTNGAPILTYTGHTDSVETVAWSPDGTMIASGSDDNTVQVWDAKTKRRLTTYTRHQNSVLSVAWSPDGTLIASGSSDHSVQVWNAQTGQRVYKYTGHTAGVGPVAWSPDGKRIASGSDDNTVQVWDATSGGNRLTYRGHMDGVNALAWSPDGKRIASGSGDAIHPPGNDYTVQVWDAGTGGTVYTYKGHTSTVLAVVWQPKGGLTASGGVDKTVQVWQGE